MICWQVLRIQYHVFKPFFVFFHGVEGNNSLSRMRVTKRTAMHNIFDSACLKGYSFPFKIRSVHHCKRKQWEAARLDVLRCVCLSLKFVFLSVTVRDDMYKNHHSMAYNHHNWWRRAVEWSAIWRVAVVCGSQSAELHLLVKGNYNSIKAGLKRTFWATAMTTVILLNGRS